MRKACSIILLPSLAMAIHMTKISTMLIAVQYFQDVAQLLSYSTYIFR